MDLYAILKPTKDAFIVRQPKRESMYFIACVVLGLCVFVFSVIRHQWIGQTLMH
jgi:ATP/ADP translocase